MRNIIIGIVLAMIIVVTISIVYSVDGKSIRNQEVSDALDSAVEGTVETLMKQTYSIDNSDQFIADMLEDLIVQIDSNCDLTVNVLDQDYEKGLLSVEAVETYKYPNGKTGTVSCTKTVILEHKQSDSLSNDPVMYTAEFYIPDSSGNRLYKKYELSDSSILPEPVAPIVDGKTFIGWQLDGSDFSFVSSSGELYKITTNIVLIAKFE